MSATEKVAEKIDDAVPDAEDIKINIDLRPDTPPPVYNINVNVTNTNITNVSNTVNYQMGGGIAPVG
jgi:hypothetical protein